MHEVFITMQDTLCLRGQKTNARKALKKVRNVDYKYFILYLITFYTIFFWNFINNDKIKKEIFNTIL